jgi:outer membrane immunogenic protein
MMQMRQDNHMSLIKKGASYSPSSFHLLILAAFSSGFWGSIMIKKHLVFGLLSAMVCTSAMAADLRSTTPVYAGLPAFSWSGFYVGVNLGYGGDRYIYPFSIGLPGGAGFNGTASVTSGGILGGGQVGYNLSLGNNFLIGFEADFDGAGIRGKATLNTTSFSGATLGNASAGGTIDDLGTARVRVGYSWDRFLIYTTGGFAYGLVNSQGSFAVSGLPVAPSSISLSGTPLDVGWTVGAGFEYAITNNLTMKTEYLYVNLGNNNNLMRQAAFGPVTISLGQKVTTNIVRAGLNYKVDWLTPVVAKF